MGLYSLVGSWLRIWSRLYLPFQQCTFPTQFLCYSGEQIKFRSSPFPHLCCCSVAKLYLTLWPHGLQHTRLLCPSLSPRICSNSCLLSLWCHPTISSSVTPFFSCLQSFPASESFLMSQLFTSGGQHNGASASASVLPMNIQGWFPLGLTGLIFSLSKELYLLLYCLYTMLNFSVITCLNAFYNQKCLDL